MKKAIVYRICSVVVISVCAIIFLNFYLQVKSARETMLAQSSLRLNQISQILKNNDADIVKLKKNLKEDYFIRAEAAAYIVQNQPEVLGDLREMRKIAALLQVDELHLFDTKGILYTGSEPKYYNYTFDSGEQMSFFLPMLKDNTLRLCQEVTPNTAENKLMQYLAVWCEDKSKIIQIGMEPIRLIEALKKNELSHIFNMLTSEEGITTFALDLQTELIAGSTNAAFIGISSADIGIDLSDMDAVTGDITKEIKLGQKRAYCVLRKADGVLLGVSSTYENMYQNIPENMLLVVGSLCMIALVIIFFILKMLDRIVLNGIYGITSSMKKIAGGDLDSKVEVNNSPEFVELSDNINHLVNSLLETTGKLSLVFQNVNVPIAVYEYRQDMKRVLGTSKIGEILELSEEEVCYLLSDRAVFAEKIKEICTHPFAETKDIYRLQSNDKHFVKIHSYQKGSDTLGVLVDVTQEILEKKQIEKERDIDILTEISSRRAFFDKMEKLFDNPKNLKTAVLLMADLDNLKQINDNWGHEYGDRILKCAANLLKECEAPKKIAARLSGDEFVLVIYGADSQEEIVHYLDLIYEKMLKTAFVLPNKEILPVRLSGGYVFYPECSKPFREMLRLADRTMYEVKKSDKGHFVKCRNFMLTEADKYDKVTTL